MDLRRLEGREWTEEEIEILKEWYPIEGTKVKDRFLVDAPHHR